MSWHALPREVRQTVLEAAAEEPWTSRFNSNPVRGEDQEIEGREARLLRMEGPFSLPLDLPQSGPEI